MKLGFSGDAPHGERVLATGTQYPKRFGNRPLGTLEMIDPEGATDRIVCITIEVQRFGVPLPEHRLWIAPPRCLHHRGRKVDPNGASAPRECRTNTVTEAAANFQHS